MQRVLYYVSKPIRNLVLCNDNKVKVSIFCFILVYSVFSVMMNTSVTVLCP